MHSSSEFGDMPDVLGDIRDVAGIRAYAEELEKQFRRLQEDAPKLQQRTRDLRATEKSGDGLITATVGANGQLIELEIDPRIYRQPNARGLADEIVGTVKKAAAKAQEAAVELLAEFVPREQLEAHLSGDIDAVAEHMRKQIRGE